MTDVNKRFEKLEERVKRLEEKTFMSLDTDVLLDKAKETIKQYSEVSASLLQRRLAIGYARAARLLDLLEEEGLVGKGEGAKPRKVLKK
ncbi:MAG: DNA translocase FtsK [bacterium]|nr:DNA translocase FtsK [bacterium]